MNVFRVSAVTPDTVRCVWEGLSCAFDLPLPWKGLIELADELNVGDRVWLSERSSLYLEVTATAPPIPEGTHVWVYRDRVITIASRAPIFAVPGGAWAVCVALADELERRGLDTRAVPAVLAVDHHRRLITDEDLAATIDQWLKVSA